MREGSRVLEWGRGSREAIDHRRLLEWPHLGPGPSTRRGERVRSAGLSLLPRRVPGWGAPHNPSQGCEVRTAHSAGGLCPAFFRIFFVGGSVGWGAGPSGPGWALKRGFPPQELPGARRSRGAGRLSRFRHPRSGAVLPRRREPRPRGAAASRRPRGPLSPPRRPARRSPAGWPVGRASAAPRGYLVPGPRATARPRAGLRGRGDPERGKTPPARRESPPPRLPVQDSPGLGRGRWPLVHAGGKLRRERPGPA